jgi:hypothetical protein
MSCDLLLAFRTDLPTEAPSAHRTQKPEQK